MRVVIGGGYTGGHIHCALAIAEALRATAAPVDILLVGARGGREVGEARAAGYPMETVWISGLDRRRSVRGVARNLLLGVQLLVSRTQARRILERFAPAVVVGVGGYASAPIVAAAQRRGVPTVIHEANGQPGIANRLLARRADVVCVGDAAAARRLGGDRARVTGNPVRAGVRELPRDEARRRLGLPASGRLLLVTGGSLGSRVLNAWVLAHQHRLGAAVLWQSGRAHEAAARAALRAPGVTLAPYVDDMAAAYAAADLVVAGAGALTLSELALLGKPCVIVPAPDVTEDHQRENAAALARAGAAVCAPEEVPAALFARVAALLDDDDARAALGARMRRLARPDAAARIAGEIVRVARGAA